jgi:hypothetical protein
VIPLDVRADKFKLRVAVGGAKRVRQSSIDVGCVALLGTAVLIQGIVVALGLPHRVELLADLAAVALLVFIAVAVARSGATIPIPYLAVALGALLVVAAMRSDDFLRLLVSARNFLLLPALALGLAALGPSERRNRAVLLTAMALIAIEFLVTIVQAFTVADQDQIVGTLGDFSGPSTAFAIIAGACVALGVFAAGAGRAWWLSLGVLLPLFSIWASIRIVPLVVPIAAGSIVLAAWWAARGASGLRGRLRQPALVGLTALVTTAALFAGYAIFRASDFQLFTSSQQRDIYLRQANVYGGGDRGRSATGARRASASNARGVPGRLTQYEAAEHLIERSPASFLFGKGLGTTTYAVNLGIDKPVQRGARLAGYSDFGTVLVELGWLGIGIAAACGVALGLGSLGAARRAPPGTWTRALLIAYPGVLATMAALAFEGTPFRNIGSATIFWLLTGLALASILERRDRPRPVTP